MSWWDELGLPSRATLGREELWMTEALKEAWAAYGEGEVPVGAVLVHNDHIVARGHNQVEQLKDATAHAEMICLSAGANALGDWRLTDATLYISLEPCAMCAGAILLSRVERVVWGAPDHRHGANGSWTDLFALQHPTHQLTITGNVLAEASAHLLKRFFQEQRKKPAYA
jgi:tRNA(adenine34) deaminase